MPGSRGRDRSGAKAPATAADCPEAEFVRLGYETGALHFHVACRDAGTFRACVLATGPWPYNKFDPDAVADVLGGMFGEFMLMEVGRASSPLIVVRLALWEHQRAGTRTGRAVPLDRPEVERCAQAARDAGRRLVADLVTDETDGGAVHAVRLW